MSYSWPTGHMCSMTIPISVNGWITHTVKTIRSTSTKLIVLNIEAAKMWCIIARNVECKTHTQIRRWLAIYVSITYTDTPSPSNSLNHVYECHHWMITIISQYLSLHIDMVHQVYYLSVLFWQFPMLLHFDEGNSERASLPMVVYSHRLASGASVELTSSVVIGMPEKDNIS